MYERRNLFLLVLCLFRHETCMFIDVSDIPASCYCMSGSGWRVCLAVSGLGCTRPGIARSPTAPLCLNHCRTCAKHTCSCYEQCQITYKHLY